MSRAYNACMADTERVNIDGGDEDVRKLNSFLIDPVGIAHDMVSHGHRGLA